MKENQIIQMTYRDLKEHEQSIVKTTIDNVLNDFDKISKVALRQNYLQKKTLSVNEIYAADFFKCSKAAIQKWFKTKWKRHVIRTLNGKREIKKVPVFIIKEELHNNPKYQ